MGDPLRAFRAVESSFDQECVPMRVADDDRVHAARLDARAKWMLGFVDGRTVLSHVISTCGLPADEAREGVLDLVERGLVIVRPEGGGAWTKGWR
jgi:hypothetical protein